VTFAAATDQTFPALAFDGANYMVVWQDGRTGTYPDLYGARMSTAGILLDAGGIAISTAPNFQGSPAIAFDGVNYMVVWQDMRNGLTYKIYAARVSTSGVVLDPAGILLSAAASSQFAPAIGFDGDNFLVVWQDLRNGPADIYATRVSKSGAVLDPEGIAVSTAVNPQAYPAVAFDGTNYLVVWHDERNSSHYDLYGARVSKSGVVLDPGGIGISTLAKRQGFPAVAFDGTNYMVVWQDDRSGFYDIYACRVSTSGGVLDPGGKAISAALSDQSYPAIAFDGVNYLVVWQDYRNGYYYDIYGSRVSKSAAVLDSAGIAISTAATSQMVPAIAFGGVNYFTVWQDGRTGSYDVFGARVSSSGVVLDPAGLTDLVFSSSSATIEHGCVVISWQTGVDAPLSSFLVTRADSRDGDFQPVIAPISEAPGQVPGRSYSCTDCTVLAGVDYWFEIVLQGSLSRETSGPIGVHVTPAPTAYRAYQSYPNPFNPVCTIRYDIPRAGRVSLHIVDTRGSLVRTLVDAWREPGEYRDVWDGRADDGSELPSGVYFYLIESGQFAASRKMVLLR